MIKLRQSSMNQAIAKLKKLGSAARYGAHEGVAKQGQALLRTIQSNMSLTDHSLQDLADMGHPYSKVRHSSIQIHEGTSAKLADTRNYIHTHSGKLVRAMRGEKKTDKIVYQISVNESAATNKSGDSYARYVFQGTGIMHGRPIMRETANTPQVKSEIEQGMLRSIAKAISKV
jgi:hypothetical protein